MYFVRSIKDDDEVPYARPRLQHKGYHPAMGTVIINYETELSSYKDTRLAGYSVDAHELGHILVNSKHHNNEKIDNFLHKSAKKRTNDIPRKLCEKIKNYKEFLIHLKS